MFEQAIKKEIHAIQESHQMRQLFRTEDAHGPWLSVKGQRMLNLASNNYLGYAGHPRLIQAAQQALTSYGVGATASRLIIGNHPLYEAAEQALTSWKRGEKGLILQSGYAANVGIISALVGRHDVVFSDRLNHASIVDGILLSRAAHKRYRHNDLDHLEKLLKQTASTKRKLIVTDALFSMDGDFARLKELVTLKKRYDAWLMVDEAHSSGLYGPAGEGLSHHLNVHEHIDIQMGTFSKALGVYGAYVIGSVSLIHYLTNKMRSFIYSTALPPVILGTIHEAIQLVQGDAERRKHVHRLAKTMRSHLQDVGFDCCGSESHIIPLRIGSNEQTVQFSHRLQQEGIAAIAVRPPTVPENEARIRLTVTADHTEKDLHWAVTTIQRIGHETGVMM